MVWVFVNINSRLNILFGKKSWLELLWKTKNLKLSWLSFIFSLHGVGHLAMSPALTVEDDPRCADVKPPPFHKLGGQVLHIWNLSHFWVGFKFTMVWGLLLPVWDHYHLTTETPLKCSNKLYQWQLNHRWSY